MYVYVHTRRMCCRKKNYVPRLIRALSRTYDLQQLAWSVSPFEVGSTTYVHNYHPGLHATIEPSKACSEADWKNRKERLRHSRAFSYLRVGNGVNDIAQPCFQDRCSRCSVVVELTNFVSHRVRRGGFIRPRYLTYLHHAEEEIVQRSWESSDGAG